MDSRIGIYGGTFDPIHIGHLVVAQEAVERCALGRVLFVPSGDPPHKSGACVAGATDRAEMVARAIAGDSRFALSRVEVDRPGRSYTVETLEALRRELGPVEMVLLIGADNAVDMANWCAPERVVDLARVTVLARPGADLLAVRPDLAKRMTFLDSPVFDVSSTAVRDRLRKGQSVRYLVPDVVIAYIAARGLYRSGNGDAGS